MITQELIKIAKEIKGMEFPTQEALNLYLKEHPLADRSNHSVNKHFNKKVDDLRTIESVFKKLGIASSLAKYAEDSEFLKDIISKNKSLLYKLNTKELDLIRNKTR